MTDNVRMFIGTSANGEDARAEMCYEYSLKRYASRPVDITWMRQTNDETSFWHGWNDTYWSTPFSGFRWGIPEACNFEGRAIYTDVDMLNFRDIAELFDMEIPEDKWMLARNGKRFGGKEFCVILFDCAKFKGKMPPVKEWKNNITHHQQFMQAFINNGVVGHLEPQWNSHDGDAEPFKLLHYTDMSTQPWRPSWYKGEVKDHPKKHLVTLFWKVEEEAKNNKYKLEDYQIDRGVKYNIIGK